MSVDSVNPISIFVESLLGVLGKPISSLKLELTLKVSLGPGPRGAVKNRLCPKQVENYYSGRKVAEITTGLFL